MATTETSSRMHPPTLAFELIEGKQEEEQSASSGSPPETPTHHEHPHNRHRNHHRHDPSHGIMAYSSTSSICSFSTESTTPSKLPKRVRFEESVCWSYFEVTPDLPEPPSWREQRRPTPQKASFWQRFRDRNLSSDVFPRRSSDDEMQRSSIGSGRSGSTDGGPHHRHHRHHRDPSKASLMTTTWYTSHQPLRETSGRRYGDAETRATWRRQTTPYAAVKGDWNELLSNPRQSRLVV